MDKLDIEISDDIKRIAGSQKGARKTYSMMSGKAKAGTIDESAMTVDVVLTIDADADGEGVATEVLLNAVSLNNNGVILYPADGSDVIVGEVDGPGTLTVIKCSNLVKMGVKVGDVQMTLQSGKAEVMQGAAVFTMSGGKFNMKNGSKDFKTVMDKFFSDVAAMSFSNSGGPTGPSANVSALTADKTDFDALFN